MKKLFYITFVVTMLTASCATKFKTPDPEQETITKNELIHFGLTGKIIQDLSLASDYIFKMEIQNNYQKTVSVGTFKDNDGYDKAFVARHHNNGSLDTTFDNDGIMIVSDFSVSTSQSPALAIQQEGNKILLSGYSPTTTFGLIIRYNEDGTLDQTFNGNGRATLNITKIGRAHV